MSNNEKCRTTKNVEQRNAKQQNVEKQNAKQQNVE
jgi:hypothetical protein